MSRITMKDLAKQLGVSTGTIHRALTGKPGVGEEMRNKIIKATEEQGYKLNTIASTLKRKPLRIVVAIPELNEESSFFYSSIWDGYRKYVSELSDYNFEIIEVPLKKEQHAISLRVIYERYNGKEGIDGLLMSAPIKESNQKEVQLYCDSNIPTVFINGDNKECNRLGCVYADYDTAGQMMAEQMSMNIKPEGTVLLLSGDKLIDAHYLVAKGFREFILKNDLPYNILEVHGYYSRDEVSKKAEKILLTNKVDAICCVNARGSVLISRLIDKYEMVGNMCVIGSDTFEENVKSLKKGIFTNLIYKGPYQQAYFGAKMLFDYLLKDIKPNEETRLIDCIMVYKSTVHLFEKESQR